MQKPLELHAGEAFGRYELLLPIARGGMSTVWAGRLSGTRGFQKLVAIKTLIAEKAERSTLERMLLDEARLAAQVQHPNVAQYLDVGERDGVLYVVMEWVDGEALGSLMRHASPLGGIPLAISVQIIEQTMKGLHGAHELKNAVGTPLGLVHCDISPQNLMISESGAVRLIDFGIAKATRSRARQQMVTGKLAFMSPEQARNQVLDRRSDLFSLGIVLYLLTTGRHPFAGKTSEDVLRTMLRNTPIVPPSEIHPSYPRALEKVVMRALQHHRDARFSSAAEMLYALIEAFPGRAPEPELGAFVQNIVGPMLAGRRAAIAAALSAAESRAEARIAAEQRAAEQRAAEKRAAEQRAAEQRAAEQRAAEKRAAEQRAAEQRAIQQRIAEQRAAEQYAAQQRIAEQRAAEQLLADQRAAQYQAEQYRQTTPPAAQPPVGVAVAPEVVRLMQAADTSAPVEQEVARFRSNRNMSAIAVVTCVIAIGTVFAAFLSGTREQAPAATVAVSAKPSPPVAAAPAAPTPSPAPTPVVTPVASAEAPADVTPGTRCKEGELNCTRRKRRKREPVDREPFDPAWGKIEPTNNQLAEEPDGVVDRKEETPSRSTQEPVAPAVSSTPPVTPAPNDPPSVDPLRSTLDARPLPSKSWRETNPY